MVPTKWYFTYIVHQTWVSVSLLYQVCKCFMLSTKSCFENQWNRLILRIQINKN